METFKRTPMQLFKRSQYFVIPLFQRPYVWKQDEQWEPLWRDVVHVAELRLREPDLNPQHFLGAVVLQGQGQASGQLNVWNVIDGQQRLTTVQLLADATGAVLAQDERTARFAMHLQRLTHNRDDDVEANESSLKLRHLNRDRAAFDEVMTVDPPIDYAALTHADSLMTRAHQYFTTVVTQWLGVAEDGNYALRAEQLVHVLTDDLQLVTIELQASENSQEIFETLNARGTPLTAADLVRNFVFQQIEIEGGDSAAAYREHWPFETAFWSKEVSVGRYLVSRSSLFLNQWLIAQTGEEVSPQSTFARFKSYVERQPELPMSTLLPLIKAQADEYQAWTETAGRSAGSLDATEMAMYRALTSGTELIKPLLLWLHKPGRDLQADAIASVIRAVESWIVRRQILRLATSDMGRIVAGLIASYDAAPSNELPTLVRDHLARLNVSSTYWPGDEEIRLVLLTEPVYNRFPRARMRTYLEAVENQLRSETGQPQVERAGWPIEHILPQKWRDNWPVPEDQEFDRQAHVHRLGNLTLLTTALNSKVSNADWPTKRKALLDHNTIKLTGRIISDSQTDDWNEERIDQRTAWLIDQLLKVWPVPAGHLGQVVDPAAKTQDWVEVKHLIGAGLLKAGDVLTATHYEHKGAQAVIADDGRIELDGKRFETPSGAGRHLRGKATNGWYFWAVADGRRLRDLRVDFESGVTAAPRQGATQGGERIG